MKNPLICLLAWGFFLYFLQTPLVYSMPIQSAKIVSPKIEYQNVVLNKLISIYKHAYVRQGFHIRATIKKDVPDGGRVIRLVLDMTNAAYPARKKASAIFLFYSPDANACTPCSVTMETLSAGDFTEYSGEEWNVFMHQLVAADKRAQDEIKELLGKSFPPLGML